MEYKDKDGEWVSLGGVVDCSFDGAEVTPFTMEAVECSKPVECSGEITFDLGKNTSRKLKKWHRKIMLDSYLSTFKLYRAIKGIRGDK